MLQILFTRFSTCVYFINIDNINSLQNGINKMLWIWGPRLRPVRLLSVAPEMWHVYEGFYNFSKVCLKFFSFLNVVFFRLFYDNITFQHLFIIIKCPAELNFDCKILIRSVPSTFVTELLLRGYVFLTFPKPTPSCMRSETNNNALSNLSYNGY